MPISITKSEGLITKAVGGFFYVEIKDGRIIQCRGKGSLKNKGQKPLVGDRVEIEISHDENRGMVNKIFKRQNSFVRPPVANVEVFVILASLHEPEIQLKIIDKFLVMTESNRAEAILCISKSDLADEGELEAIREIYEPVYPVVFISYKESSGQKKLLELIGNRVAAFAGPSGVGKTTLINNIIPHLDLETGHVSNKTGRGKHTTRHTEIFKTCNDQRIFDTPGFTSFELIGIKSSDLQNLFPEIRQIRSNCKYNDCKHISEPECRVKAALISGEISEERYKSYKSLMEELMVEENKRY